MNAGFLRGEGISASKTLANLQGLPSYPLFEALSDGIVLADAAGEVLYMNKAATLMLEVDATPGRFQTICDLLCHRLKPAEGSEAAISCPMLNGKSKGESVAFHGRFSLKALRGGGGGKTRASESWKELRVQCLPSRLPACDGTGGEVYLVLIADATADAEIERQKEDWRQMFAHDLRSPLTSIYATIRLIQEAAGRPLPAGGDAVVAAADHSCRKMMELIALYLDVARLDAGVAPINHAPIRLADAVRAEIAAQDVVARGKRLKIALAVPDEIIIGTDPNLLARVVQNVLDNAVKFTPLGGRIELSARVDGEQAELSIKDSGAGIAPDELPLLFDRYHQARARRAGKIQGTGLGLTFCREALKHMGGSIGVGSTLGEGTEFVIRLPLAAQPGNEPASKEAL